MGDSRELIEHYAAGTELLSVQQHNKSFRRSYHLDIFALTNCWLTDRGWNELFFLTAQEWAGLTAGDKALCSSDGFTDQRTKCVYISPHGTTEKRRFTVGHELGHLFLHLDNYDGSAPLPDEAEVEANEFSRMLLAPPNLVKQWIEENLGEPWFKPGNGQSIARAAAKDFGLSTRTAAKALKSVGCYREEMESVLQHKGFQFPEKQLDGSRHS